MKLYQVIVLFFLNLVGVITINAQTSHGEKFLDSASNTIDSNHFIAQQYLDSIPKPLSESIKGHIACYYELKVLINSKNEEDAKQYQNSILTLKYAELENNYDLAGWASLELFYSAYIRKKDSSAYHFLDKAHDYYTLADNRQGLAEVTQMEALDELNKGNFINSNNILLDNLEHYKSFKDDGYYQLYGLFLITSNYLELDNLTEAHVYFNNLKNLKADTSITPALYNSHLATLYGDFAEFHFNDKAMDSTLFYLNKSKRVKDAMTDEDKRNYFNLYADYFDYEKNYQSKNNYIDSLRFLEDNVLRKTMDASLLIGDVLLQSENELNVEKRKKELTKTWAISLSAVLLIGLGFYLIKNKKTKQIIRNFKKNKDEFAYLKDNHEKLKAKVKGIEGYLSEIKIEIKNIAAISELKEQQNRVKELYKKIQLNSSTLFSSGEDHLNLINDLNVDFFNQLSTKHPKLNSSEKIICYYLFMDFTNKEISSFTNSSVRAVESKRYRISSKLNLKQKNMKLSDYLKESFS
ncbi:helix-turn-helix transcriptional regulator [Nonlabens dokdonensis]|uniref:helix-turn-helix transcriptional regulator n=1 Tax=Nonlabens dokdonensis TaxID=328515 RepID=UPI0011B46C74|nr:hypothetical protein [Nonlabens dokdonensis]